MNLTAQDLARYPRPGTAAPAKIAFAPDGRRLTFLFSEAGGLERALWELDLAGGERRVLVSARGVDALSRDDELRRERQRLRETGVTHYAWAQEAAVLLVTQGGDAIVDGQVLARGVVDPQLSRDGQLLAFVRDSELWADGRRLTFDAEPGLTNGLADYVAQEEMHRASGFWIAPDGRHIAFEQADERHVPVYPIVHQGKAQVEVEEHRYPFAGAANPKVRLGVVPVAGGPVVWMDLGDGSEYLARVDWAPDGRLFVQTQSRDQRRLELRAFDAATGIGQTLLVEESPLWVNLHDMLRFRDDGTFLWASERSGFRNLYLYREDACLRALTAVDWPVDELLRVTPTEVWFAGHGGRPTERHIWRLSLAGGAPERMSDAAGWHEAVVSPDGADWVDVHQSRAQAVTVTLRGRQAQVIHAPDAVVDLPAPEHFSFTSRDGETLWAALYRPEQLPAPLLVSVYGGPQAQTVQDSWLQTVDLRAQWLAQKGFLVVKVDGRGSARRGLAFEGALAERLGDIELRDQVDGVRHLQDRGLVDGDRVGIYGWSYGGYLTLMGLCRAPEVFQAGVAGAPVTDWDGYDTHYTERYLRTPVANPDGYRASSVLTHAQQLAGRLLLIHGMLDENVHFRHSARLMDGLDRLGKRYELMVLPNERHTPRDPAVLAAEEERLAAFFVQHLSLRGSAGA